MTLPIKFAIIVAQTVPNPQNQMRHIANIGELSCHLIAYATNLLTSFFICYYYSKMEDEKKIFDHETASVSDAIRLVGELEHIRSHALRSAVVAEGTEDEMFYLILAQQAKELRRSYMQDHFPDVDSKLWCLCKSAATLRQIAYEIWSEKAGQLKEIDNIVDTIWGKALGKDLSDCESCAVDKGDDIIEV